MISTFDSIALLSSLVSDWSDRIAIPRAAVCAVTHIAVAVISDSMSITMMTSKGGDPATFFDKSVSELTRVMRLIEIAIGVILLGGAAWTTVRTYKGRGISSILVLAFAVFLVGLGLAFLFGAFGELLRNLRFGSEWLK